MIGTSFGPYRIESLIGRGGMGEVYQAVDTGQDGRRVALKVLGAGLSDDPQFAARFRREAQIAARLSDPHLVPIHGYGEIDGQLFLDMQLLDGRELADAIAQDGPLPPQRALAILEQVARALDTAHADGLVHRDVKPSNILLTHPTDGRAEFAYLLDFGIARATDPGSRTALTRTGAVIGTLAYMAPERFLAQPAGPASDVYSLTCVLHEMLTGTRPYPGSGYPAQVAGHLHQPPPRPSTLRPGLPATLDTVVARGMAKDPAARFPTASDLVQAARDALAASGPEPAPASSAGPRRGAPTVLDTPPLPTWVPPVPAGPAPSWSPPPTPPPASPPTSTSVRRRRRWLPALGAAVLAVAVLATVLIVNRPGTGADTAAAPQAPQAPADALPSGAPITERTLVGAAPDAGSRPVVAELEGTPVLVVTRSFEITVLDMATGEPIGEPIEGFGVMAATAARVDGRSVVITGSVDRVIRLWDLATGEPLATTLTGHTDTVTALAVSEVDGRTVLLSGSDDKTIRRWDLATAAPIGAPLTGMTSGVTILSVIRTGGRPVVLATAFDSPVLSWDIAHGTALGPPIPNVYNTITAVELPGGLAVLSHPDHLDTEVVDVRTGAPLDGYPSGLKTSTPPIASVVVAGRPLLFDTEIEAIKIRDLRTGEPVGSPLTGHEGMIRSLTPVTVGGSTYLVSSSSDRTIRIWDLTARAGG